MLTSTNLSNKERNLLLMGFISESNVSPIIEKILEINEFDDIKEKEIADYVRKPITLHLSTYGGHVYTGLSLYGVIENSNTKIITISRGYCMSAGLFVYLAGHERLSHNLSTFMYHEVAMFVYDKVEGIKQDLEEANRLQDIIDNIILSKTQITKEKLDEIKKSKSDWYIPATEAIKLGLVESIV